MSTIPNEMEHVIRACSGDRCALEELLLLHGPSVAGHIGPRIPSSLRGAIGVDDVMQQTFLEAFRSIDRFEPRTPRSFHVWLRTIAECQMQNNIKALTRKKRGGEFQAVTRSVDNASSLLAIVEILSGQSTRPSHKAMVHEAIQAVQVGIASLPDDQRTAIRLRFLEGKSLVETATQMERSRDAVRSLIHRAKQRLRETLGRSSRWLLSR